ncbi:MAG: hypothetical protein JJT96_11385 [Opitutales bacterium]|nr:hypothetical protein [Opitutales bacterium]
MPKKPKKKLTPEQRREKKRRKAEFQTIYINGKQKRLRREPMIDGLGVDDFIRRNADPVWLHRSESWEELDASAPPPQKRAGSRPPSGKIDHDATDLPF